MLLLEVEVEKVDSGEGCVGLTDFKGYQLTTYPDILMLFDFLLLGWVQTPLLEEEEEEVLDSKEGWAGQISKDTNKLHKLKFSSLIFFYSNHKTKQDSTIDNSGNRV